MRFSVLFVMLEIILSGSAQSDGIQSDRRQPRCKNPSGKPGQTLVKSCTDKDVCTLGKNNRAKWQTCPLVASQDTLKAIEANMTADRADVDSKLSDIEASLKDLFEQHLEIIRMLHDIVGPTTLLPSTMVTSAAPVWRKVYALNTAGGLFANLDEAKKKNIDDPEADLFSIFFELESMRNADGVFQFKLCYPELTQFASPCNEWFQSSNPVTERTITGFVGIALTFTYGFPGMHLDYSGNVMNAGYGWWYSVGTVASYASGVVPGPVTQANGGLVVKLVEMYVLY